MQQEMLWGMPRISESHIDISHILKRMVTNLHMLTPPTIRPSPKRSLRWFIIPASKIFGKQIQTMMKGLQVGRIIIKCHHVFFCIILMCIAICLIIYVCDEIYVPACVASTLLN